MDNAVKARLQSVRFGEVQAYKNIAIIPLIAPVDGDFQYTTLGEALGTPDFAITEVSSAGSVPELMAVNRIDKPVLLIDGEELAGAKQNRVLNTSILLKETSETKIPVSCTERGRWSYVSSVFSESGNVMAYKSRSRKASSVLCSLEGSGGYMSNQAEVWDDVAELQLKAGAHSPTSAMNDVFKSREEDLRKCDEIFKPLPNQVGLVAFIRGTPVGVDMVSLTSAYAKLHAKLVRSYTLEGLLAAPKPSEAGSTSGPQPSTLDSQPCPESHGAPAQGAGGPTEPRGLSNPQLEPSSSTLNPLARKSSASPAQLSTTLPALARSFLDEITSAEEHQFPSVGYGTDHRFKGKALAGSALVHENELIHAAFFRLDDAQQPDRIIPFSQRRRHFAG